MSADLAARGMRVVAVGALAGAVAVGLGAFGAHALKERLDAPALELWRTAVLYHALHALALLAHGLFLSLRGGARSPWPAWAFAGGIALFSGSLYALALGAARGVGAITPFGGALWIAAWLGFAWQAWRARATP